MICSNNLYINLQYVRSGIMALVRAVKFDRLQHCCRVATAAVVSCRQSHNMSMPSCVLVSSCRDVYANLAFEDWMYQNGSFSDDTRSNLMLLWRNDPCVVVGRHQNVWVECNVHEAKLDNIDVARRRSGGGTVYHDTGNLNITFFTSRKNYDRKQNLTMIADALKQECNLDVAVTQRDDIIINNTRKISGTAAKLGSKVAYHHCTLLLNAKLDNVKKYLHGIPGISSKATASVRMPVANVSDFAPMLTYDESLRLLSKAYCSQFQHSGGKVGFTYVDPTDEISFPGITEMRTELKKWDWIYGHTPKFNVDRTFTCHISGVDGSVVINAEVDHGCFTMVCIKVHGCKPTLCDIISNHCDALCNNTRGCQLWFDDLAAIVQSTTHNVCDRTDDEVADWIKCINDSLLDLAVGRQV